MTPTSAPTSALDNSSQPIWVTVVGENFGVHRAVFLGPHRMEQDTTRSNHTHLYFKLNPDQGVRDLSVNVGGQLSADNPAVTRFTHHLPTFTSLYPNMGRTDACQELESVADWYKRLRTLPKFLDVDRSRLCCRPETFRLEGANFGVHAPKVGFVGCWVLGAGRWMMRVDVFGVWFYVVVRGCVWLGHRSPSWTARGGWK